MYAAPMKIRTHLFLLSLAISTTGCAVGRSVTLPDDASPEFRTAYAGKTLTCAGTVRDRGILLGLGGGVLSGAGAAVSGVAVTQQDRSVAAALAVTGAVVTIAGSALSVWSFFDATAGNTYEASAGRILSGDAVAGDSAGALDRACVMGDDPVVPSKSSTAEPAQSPPAPVTAPSPPAPMAAPPESPPAG
jgi:hypothetical protein